MQTTPFNQNTQLEAFYLLLALKEMGDDYLISDDTINKYLCIKKDDRQAKNYTFWNMLLISVLLYYYSDKTTFKYHQLQYVLNDGIKVNNFSEYPLKMLNWRVTFDDHFDQLKDFVKQLHQVILATA